MNKLHKSSYASDTFAPKEGQRELLCNNSGSFRCPSLGLNPSIFSTDTLDALEKLGDVLKHIHERMESEGYEVVNGVIRKYEKIKN